MFNLAAPTLGVGVDIEYISRFENIEAEKDSSFLKTTFTGNELDYCFANRFPAQHLAARFSAKEAIFKALSGFDWVKLVYGDIEILNDERGIPRASIKKEGLSDLNICLSLSHTRDIALAFVVVTLPEDNRH